MAQLSVFPYLWDDSRFAPNDAEASIHCWCLDRESNPHLLRIAGFPISCYLELPTRYKNRNISWNIDKVNLVYSQLCKLLGDDQPTSFSFGMHHKLYYYQQRPEFPMLQLAFPSLAKMAAAGDQLKGPIELVGIQEISGPVQLTIREPNRDISLVVKYLTAQGLEYCGWLSVIAQPAKQKISTLVNEWLVDYRLPISVPVEECISWRANPKVLSFDIEAYSTNHQGFPDSYHPEHVPYMISCVERRLNDPSSETKSYLIVLGDCHTDEGNIRAPTHTGQLVETGQPPAVGQPYQVIKVASDLQLIEAMLELIGKVNPQVITGYNIFGFDWHYLVNRWLRKDQPWPTTGCSLIGIQPVVQSRDWESKGFGPSSNTILHFPGIVHIDVMTAVKKDYPREMSYRLDHIAKLFLGRGKVPDDYQQMFRNYQRLLNARDQLQSLIQGWRDGLTPVYLPGVTQQQIDQANREYQEALYPIDVDADYCVEDSNLPLELLEKLHFWDTLTETASISGLGITEQQISGQGAKIAPLLYHDCKLDDIVLDHRPVEKTQYKGAFVFKGRPDIYDYVHTLDFNSLYPSIMRGFNLCFTTLVRPEMEQALDPECCHLFEGVEDITSNKPTEDGSNSSDDEEDGAAKSKASGVAYHHLFVKKEVKEGILPRILRRLIETRNKYKRLKKTADAAGDTFLAMRYDVRQTVLKVLANSIYGFLGAAFGRGLIEAARCIAAKGRELITFCAGWIERNFAGAKVIYGDTDSVMFTSSQVSNGLQAIELTEQVEQAINNAGLKELPNPLYLEGEAPSRRKVLVALKAYGSWLIDTRKTILVNGTEVDNPNYGLPLPITDRKAVKMKGVVPARRDNCTWHRECYSQLMYNILQDKPMGESLQLIVDTVLRLLRGEVPLDELVIVKGYKGSYKQVTAAMAVYAGHLSSIGRPIQPGDRVPYVIVCGVNDRLGEKMRLPDTYTERLASSSPEELDWIYYLEHLLRNTVEKLWQIGYRSQLSALKENTSQINSYRMLTEISNKHPVIIPVVQSCTDEQDCTTDYVRALQILLDDEEYKENRSLQNALVKARQKYVTGRSLLPPTVDDQPIKAMVKAYKMGGIDEMLAGWFNS